ncbi:MAG TPA: hypothetical protein PLM24_03070 [Methanothrix sp.]|nr:hypothetical protein [Methanothrix sp.]HPJ84211.1 hypothetical protein [Methanothrix sp.]HPR66097.1 hypothetical protein [Methanothrix sp.]
MVLVAGENDKDQTIRPSRRIFDVQNITLMDVIRDAAINITYLISAILIEVTLRPMFGSSSMPIIPLVISYLLEIGFLLKVVWNVLMMLDAFLEDLSNTWIIRRFKNNGQKGQEVKKDEISLAHDG